MGLHWSFNEKVGELVSSQTHYEKDGTEDRREFTYYLYQGNALLIVVAQWKEEDDVEDWQFHYTVRSWFNNKKHMEDCLGITKGENNLYLQPYNKWEKVTFYKDKITNKDLVTLVTGLVKAFPNITIEIKETEGGK